MSGRIRTLKPEWLEDERLASLADSDRLLSAALILLADDHGNGRAHPLFVASHAWPYGDPQESLAKVSGGFAALESIGFCRLYVVKNQQYFSITNWKKHQKVSHPGKPRVPLPEEADGTDLPPPSGGPPPSLPRPSGDPPETLRPDHGHDPDPDHDLRPATALACAREVPPPEPATPPERPRSAAAAVIELSERRRRDDEAPPADFGEAQRLLGRLLRKAWEGPMQRGAWMSSEGQALRDVALRVWEAAGSDGERFAELAQPLVDAWAADDWVRKQRSIRQPIATFRKGLPGYFASVQTGAGDAREAELDREWAAVQERRTLAYALLDGEALQAELDACTAREAELRERYQALEHGGEASGS